MRDFDFLRKAFFRLEELERIYGNDRDGKCNAAALSANLFLFTLLGLHLRSSP